MINFAYGSNLLRERLAARLPDARFLGTARLPGYRLAFHKIGSDGSAKCDAVATPDPEACLHGVLYRLTPAEKAVLDQIERLGHGYEILSVHVLTDQGGVAAYLYAAQAGYIDPQRLPFDWYRDYVLAGARQHGFPSQVIADIAAMATMVDPDEDRRRLNQGILQRALASGDGWVRR